MEPLSWSCLLAIGVSLSGVALPLGRVGEPASGSRFGGTVKQQPIVLSVILLYFCEGHSLEDVLAQWPCFLYRRSWDQLPTSPVKKDLERKGWERPEFCLKLFPVLLWKLLESRCSVRVNNAGAISDAAWKAVIFCLRHQNGFSLVTAEWSVW